MTELHGVDFERVDQFRERLAAAQAATQARRAEAEARTAEAKARTERANAEAAKARRAATRPSRATGLTRLSQDEAHRAAISEAQRRRWAKRPNAHPLAKARASRELRQEDAAELIGIGVKTLSRFERGVSVSPEARAKIEHAFPGVSG